jgi:S-formylglutathione hydrolase FrmB
MNHIAFAAGSLGLFADASPHRHGVSLLSGWLPITLQGGAVFVLVAAIGWRSRRWRLVWVPTAALIGVAAAALLHWYVAFAGIADNPALPLFWIWVGIAGLAVAAATLGWRATRWWRRGLSVLAVGLAVLNCGVALNMSVGYFTTVQMAWSELTAGPLPDETDPTAVAAMSDSHAVPAHGTVFPVKVPSDVSKFKHRTEFVYLPPAWYSTKPPPNLPAVMMIGGQFNTPADWIRQGNAAATIDRFAAAHNGYSPVFVFVDTGGAFGNDTECVNGPRGNVADHLTREVVPFMTQRFGVSPRSSNWGIVGWSMGGTCAVDLSVMHPEMFTSFLDIGGDLRPAAGTTKQTIARLFGGDASAWASFDPVTAMTEHGPYRDVSGSFLVSTKTGPRVANDDTGAQAQAADALCGLGRFHGIACAVRAVPGMHNWPFAQEAFSSSLTWLAGQVGTPSVPRTALPGAEQPIVTASPVARR